MGLQAVRRSWDLSVGPFTLHSKSQREDELQNNIAEESQDLEDHEKQNNRG
jgi:hypothetical protein